MGKSRRCEQRRSERLVLRGGWCPDGAGHTHAVAGRIAEYTPRVELTAREREVLEYVARGFSNSDIARAIGRTDETVKIHLKHIFEKLGATGRTEAVMIALQRGIIHQ